MEMFPEVFMAIDGDLRADVDRLLARLMPHAYRRVGFRRRTVYAAGIDSGGRVKLLHKRFTAALHDEDVLSARLDELVSQHRIRALGVAGLARFTDTDDYTSVDRGLAVRVLVEHQAGFTCAQARTSRR